MTIFERAKEILQSDLICNNHRFHIHEVEIYLHSADHPDPYVHCHTLQLLKNRWMFHRVGSNYRGGSFKGLDITFGDESSETYGGILVRSIESEMSEFIEGPSRLTDQLLHQSKLKSIAELDDRIGTRTTDDLESILHLQLRSSPPEWIIAVPRIGLTLKRVSEFPAMIDYQRKNYRFLTELKRIRKAKREIVLELMNLGYTADQIHQQTGTPNAIITKWIKSTRFT